MATKPPMAKFPNIRQSWRVMIRSVDRQSGTWDDAKFKIHLNDQLQSSIGYNVCVESFAIDRPSSEINPYQITCPRMMQFNSYSTATDNSSQTLLISGGNYFNRTLGHDSHGLMLQDHTLFRGDQQIGFKIRDVSGGPLALGERPWAMTLVIFQLQNVSAPIV